MENSKNTNMIAIAAVVISLVGICFSIYIFAVTKQLAKYEVKIQQTNLEVKKSNEAVAQLQARVDQIEKTTTDTKLFVDKYKNQIDYADFVEMNIMLSDHNKKIDELQRTLKKLYGVKK